MKTIKRFLKWLIIVFIFVFILLSITPYFFSNGLKEAEIKPYNNSVFFEFNHTKFHFRIFVPKHIKYKTLLIHGFSGSTFSFRNNYKALTNNNTLVVAMDMPAFGYSDKSEHADYTDSNKINAIHFLLQHIDKITNSQKWNLIGHSMGGIVIGQYASSFRQHTKSLIFIDGLPFTQLPHSKLQKVILYPPILKWSDVLLENYFLNQKYFSKLLSSAYGQIADTASLYGYMKPFEIKGSGSAILRMGSNYSYTPINDSVINSMEKLIIWGNQDKWIPLMSAVDFLKKPHAQSLIIDGAGHCPMETHADEVNHVITDFISKLD